MDDFDPAIVAAMFLQLGLDLGGIADQEKFADVADTPAAPSRRRHDVGRSEIAAHRIQGDLHRSEILRTLAFAKRKCGPYTCLRRVKT